MHTKTEKHFHHRYLHRFLVYFALSCSISHGGTDNLNDWCGARGLSRLGGHTIASPETSRGWDDFQVSYLTQLEELAQPFRQLDPDQQLIKAEQLAKVLADEEKSWKLKKYAAQSKEEREKIDREYFTAQKHNAEIKALAAYVLIQNLDFYEGPTKFIARTNTIYQDPGGNLPPDFTSSSRLITEIRGLIPPAKLVRKSPGILHPESWEKFDKEKKAKDLEIPERRRRIKELLAKPDDHDRAIDSLLGLDARELLQSDMNAHSNQFPDERTFLNSDHDYYGSNYRSFPIYAEDLKIPPHGKIVDLGAGPFKALVPLAIDREDLQVVGYELVPTRVKAAQGIIDKFGISDRAKIIEKNLSDPILDLEAADGYILMNPFPLNTSENILNNLKDVAKKSGKTFRLLIFDSASATLRTARRQPWLKPINTPTHRETRYQYFVFEVDPKKLK